MAKDKTAKERAGQDETAPSVAQVLAARQSGESDSFRVGLSVEGGGMRGAVSAAMLMAVQDLGIADHFDVYYGASSGSINVLYASSGARWDTSRVYYDYMADGLLKRNPRLLGIKTIDMEYAFDRLMTEVFPLDMEALRSAPHEVKVALTNVDECELELIDMRSSGSDFFHVLKASSWLPILSGGSYELNGTRYFDGGILLPNPMLAAEPDGCTHLVSLNTRPMIGKRSTKMSRLINRVVLRIWGRKLARAYLGGRDEWDAQRLGLGFGEVDFGTMKVMRIAPGVHPVGRLTTDYGDLLKGMRAGYEAVMSGFLGKKTDSHFEVKSVSSARLPELAQ